jgi:pyruvate,water dikinase
MDTEWAKDGKTGELFIVQARPETVHSNQDANVLKTYELQGTGKVLIEGRAVGEKIGSGKAHIIKNVADIGEFKA